MKTLYALIFACLSLQACSGQSETPTVLTNVNEYSSANEFATAVSIANDDDYTAAVTSASKPVEEQPIDFHSDDYVYYSPAPKAFDGTCPDDDHTAAVTEPASKPIEDYSIDPSIDFNLDLDDDSTATVTMPAAKPLEDYSIGDDVDFYVGDDSTGAVTAPATEPLNEHSVDTTIDSYMGDESTASVPSPSTPKLEDYSIDSGIDVYADDDGWDFKLPEQIDLDSIQASDWY